MAEQTDQTGKYDNIKLYQYGNVAARLASNEQTAPFAVGGLEKLTTELKEALKEKGLDENLLNGFHAGTMASEEGIGAAIQAYNGDYETALGKLDITDFYDLRFEQLKYALGEEKAGEARAVFEKYKGQTVGSIREKVAEAKYTLSPKAPKGMFNDKQKAEAKETIEKLKAISNLIELPEMINYEKLMPTATKEAYTRQITDALAKA